MKQKILFLVVFLLAVFLAWYFFLKKPTTAPEPVDPPQESTCRPTGCSGQVCADKNVVTTCEWKPEYACYAKTVCERQQGGQCGWTPNAAFESCLNESLKDDFSMDENVAAKADLIRVENLEPGALIESPVTIKGKARGSWYFEASFPIEIIDARGVKLAQTFVMTSENWMTAEFVPFSVTLEFQKPVTKTGFIVFHKDNPSGLPENDDQMRFPVLFEIEK